jgi:hypothetical protein
LPPHCETINETINQQPSVQKKSTVTPKPIYLTDITQTDQELFAVTCYFHGPARHISPEKLLNSLFIVKNQFDL